MAAWGMEKVEGKASGTPEGLVVDAQGLVYITDYLNGGVQVFSDEGEFLWAWGAGGQGEGEFNRPTSITFGQDGKIYIVNQNNNNVLVFQLP